MSTKPKKPASTKADKAAATASAKAAKATAAAATKAAKQAAKVNATEAKATAQKAKADAKAGTAAANSKAVTGDNSSLTVDQKRALHFNHRKLYESALKVKKAADKAMTDVGKLIKSEGGSVALIKKAIQMDTPEGEAAIRQEIEDTLEVARFEGSDMGYQMQLLADPPSVDKAFDEGKIAGLKALPRKPPHDPSVPQYKRWMEGYDAGQAVVSAKFKDSAPKPSGGTSRKDDTPKGSQPQAAPKDAKVTDSKETAGKPTSAAPASSATPPKLGVTPPAPPPETNLSMGGSQPIQPDTKH